jgi:hypothetical protein
MEETLFSAASLLTILSSLDELKESEIGVDQNDSGITVTIDGNEYRFDFNEDSTATVDASDTEMEDTEDVIDAEFAENSEDEDLEPVEGGLIKDTIKTFLVGGLVRLTSKLLK